MSDLIDYQIYGDDLQLVEVELEVGWIRGRVHGRTIYG